MRGATTAGLRGTRSAVSRDIAVERVTGIEPGMSSLAESIARTVSSLVRAPPWIGCPRMPQRAPLLALVQEEVERDGVVGRRVT